MTIHKEELINSLRQHVQKLKHLYENEKERVAQLTADKAELLKTIAKKEEETVSLSIKLNTLKLAKSISGTNNDMHDAKLKVSNLVREIDKCIALLNR